MNTLKARKPPRISSGWLGLFSGQKDNCTGNGEAKEEGFASEVRQGQGLERFRLPRPCRRRVERVVSIAQSRRAERGSSLSRNPTSQTRDVGHPRQLTTTVRHPATGSTTTTALASHCSASLGDKDRQGYERSYRINPMNFEEAI